jgi:hypothetical protein
MQSQSQYPSGAMGLAVPEDSVLFKIFAHRPRKMSLIDPTVEMLDKRNSMPARAHAIPLHIETVRVHERAAYSSSYAYYM